MATATHGKKQGIVLNARNLDFVKRILEKHQLEDTVYYRLGLSLGLLENTLKAIEADHSKAGRCLLECLSAWLRQKDSVKSKGVPSLDTLVASLRSIGEHAVADGIDNEHCMVLARHQLFQAIQRLLSPVVILLYKEKITKERLPPTEGTDVVLAAVQEAVFDDPQNLKKFAAILQQFSHTVSMGTAILECYNSTCSFPDESNETTVASCGEESIKIRIPRSMTPKFEDMRAKWTSTIFNVHGVMNVSIENLKFYLIIIRPDITPRVTECKTTQDILQLISEKCSLINLSLLEGVVNHFKIEEARPYIQEYKRIVEDFCNTMPLNECLLEQFSPVPYLCCEKITFIVDRDVEDLTLKDIDVLVKYAFETRANLVDVKRSNSFTITCSFAIGFTESLIASSLENLELLKKNGLLQLTIGYSTVYSHNEVNEASEGFKSLASAVYTSRDTLEQIVISLMIRCQPIQELAHENKMLKDENSLLNDQLVLFKTEKDINEEFVAKSHFDISEENKSLSEEKTTVEYDYKTMKDDEEAIVSEEKLKRELETLKVINRKMVQDIDAHKKRLAEAQVTLEAKEATLTSNFEAKEATFKAKEEEIKALQLRVTSLSLQLNASEENRETLQRSIKVQIPTIHDDWKELFTPPVYTLMTAFSGYRKIREDWYSPGFLSHPSGYEMCLCLHDNGTDKVKGTHISLHVHLMTGDHDQELEWPFRGVVKIQLVDRRNRNNYFKEITFDDQSKPEACQRVINGIPTMLGMAANTGQGENKFITQNELVQQGSTEFVKDDSVKFLITEVIVHSKGPATITSPVEADDIQPIMEFKIANFSKHKDSNSECVSEPFYSHQGGYKFKLFVYPNGRGVFEGKSVSVRVYLMKGENDNRGLAFPFRGKIVTQIKNLCDNGKKHVERQIVFDSETDPDGKYGAKVTGTLTTFFSSGLSFQGYGFLDFLPHRFLAFDQNRNTQYLADDDTLHLRITRVDVYE